MNADMVGRDAELTVIEDVLQAGTNAAAYLCIRGEPGIGKTTLLDAARRSADIRGYSTLASAASSVEAQLSYAGLSDLLQPVVDQLNQLPDPQHTAMEAALLRRTMMGHLPDIHTVGAGTLSLLAGLCHRGPVLVAIDDVQWLDEPSRRAIAFALRRCRGPLALLVTLRDGFDQSLADLVIPGQEFATLNVRGLALAPLHEMLRRSGQVFGRATVERVQAASGGNPLLAKEVARSLVGDDAPLPSDLSSSMRTRFLRLTPTGRWTLLVAAAMGEVTARALERAGIADPLEALAESETEGIVEWRGEHLRFAHPIWREVAYQSASPNDVRVVHGLLSASSHDVEERARHLALSSPGLNDRTIAALEGAATHARLRGAPSNAAQLLGLAIARGASDPALLLQAARDHFATGTNETARELATRVLAGDVPASLRTGSWNLLGQLSYLTEDFPQAIGYLERAYDEAVNDPMARAGAAIDLGFACANLGMNQRGLDWTVRAEQNAALSGDRGLAAEAAGAAAVLVLLTGGGVDRARLDAALANEDLDRASPPNRWPSMSAALVHLWTGHLSTARPALAAIRQRFDELGIDIGLSLLLARLSEAALLDGDLATAACLVADIEEHAQLAGGEAEAAIAKACLVVLSGYRGEVKVAASHYQQLLSLTGGTRHLMPSLAAMSALGMCYLSAGHFTEAVTLLEPVADLVVALGVGEPIISPFFADAIDALVAVDKTDRAAALVEMLEDWGQRSRSRWTTGVGARGRATLLLHEGDLDSADEALARALAAFAPASYRYEVARTQLQMAAVHRRRRQRVQAMQVLQGAQQQFAQLGAWGWARNADRVIERLGLHRSEVEAMTPSERRIASLAASGLTNNSVAVRLSISPKTVEAHLTRIYRKLGIHSRAELGRWVAEHPERS